METIIGNKETFAVQIDITAFKPHVWGKTALWINGECIGNYDDENILALFIGSLCGVALNGHTFWMDELEGLNCKDMFYKINPFYNNPDDFYDLTYEEQGEYVKYDSLNMFWGENFDDYSPKVVGIEKMCRFLWVYTPLRGKDSYEVRNNIKCQDVSQAEIYEVCKKVCELIPDEYWYTSFSKVL